MRKFETLVAGIRSQEEQALLAPLAMRKGFFYDEDVVKESWEFGLDKLVMYQCVDDQTQAHIWRAKDTLDCKLHAEVIEHALKEKFPEVSFAVEVTPQFKKLPIPFISIPIKIPFTNIGWEKQPNKVRGVGNDHLATLPVHVNIRATCHLGDIKADTLFEALNGIACLHTNNYRTCGFPLPDRISHELASRRSYNPLLWLGTSVAWLLSFIVPTEVSRLVPNVIKQLGRPYAYGYPLASLVIDEPMIESGMLACAANIGSSAAIAVILAASLADELKAASKSPSSALGFTFAAMSNVDPLLGSVVGGEIARGTRQGTLANGFGNGLRFNLTAGVANDFASAKHAPFATRSIIENKPGY